MTKNNSNLPRGGHMRGNIMLTDEKVKDFKGTIRKLIAYLNPYKIQVIIVLVLAVLSSIFSVIGPMILGSATNTLASGILAKYNGTGSIDYNKISQILIILLLIYLSSSAFSYGQHWIMSSITQKIAYKLRKQLTDKINRIPLSYFDKASHGDILSRVTNDIDTISQNLNQSLQQVLSSVIVLIGVLIMMLSISVPMTFIAILIAPLSALIVAFIIKRSQRFFKAQQNLLGKVNGHVEEMYGAHIVVKAYNGEKGSIDEFDTLNNDLYKATWKSQFLSGLMQPITGFIGNVGYVAVCLFGGFLAIEGKISIGNIQAFIQYVRSFNQPISQTTQIMNILQQTAAAAERVFDFLEVEEEKPDAARPRAIYTRTGRIKVKGEVEFKNVRFGYEKRKIVIKDFSCKVEPGQTVALVGPTGAGKTTIVKLLMRFYDLNKGKILLDGIDYTKYRKNELRDIFGMVLQDAWLFNGTIKENIRYGRVDATDEDVYEAAENAYVDHFIRTLPDGYDTIINEDSSNISQGQKQLITIARAFISNPKILILDEATSSVDTRTEILIQKGLEKLRRNKTSFIIAHRLSTIKNADVILVLDKGDIVEVGNHRELLKKNGYYAKLYNSQFDK